ncbi:MAG: sulfatase, partial [Lentisphaerae bacterium]
TQYKQKKENEVMSKKDRKPNILYILADDQGYGDVSCLNPDSKIPTPHTDRLAKEGMIFTDAHSNSAVCTPTRYGVMTGRYCWRSWLKRGVLHGDSPLLIEEGRETVASLLKRQGYRTACIGKWHLGLGWQLREGETETTVDTIRYDKPVLNGPHTVGFDYSFIIPASLDMAPYCYIEDGKVVEAPTDRVEDSPRPAFWRGGPCAPGFNHETCLLEFMCRAESFLYDHARHHRDEPFFLYFPTPSPHTPHFSRGRFRGASQAGIYGDYVVEHDWVIGRLVEALNRLDLREDTLVIVTSDNGCHATPLQLWEKYGHLGNYIYRGQKSDAWDGGHRIPFIASWPGVIPEGSQCDRTICLTDLFATAAELTGAAIPENAAEDSVN